MSQSIALRHWCVPKYNLGTSDNQNNSLIIFPRLRCITRD